MEKRIVMGSSIHYFKEMDSEPSDEYDEDLQDELQEDQ